MPGAPAPAGAAARCTRPHAQATACRSCWMTSAAISRDLDLLMRGGHAQVGGAGQVRAARARSPREVRHRPSGSLAPGQVRPRRAGLLARLRAFPCPAPASLAGGVRPGWSSSRGRERGIPRVPRRRPLQPLHPRPQLGVGGLKLSDPSASAAFCAASTATSCPRSAISASRAASSGLVVTNHHHPGIPLVIKETR